MSKICSPTPENIARACQFLRQGQLVGVPTETVYGLAANALDPSAVARIYAAKQRPAHNPLIVHVADIESLKSVVAWPLAPSTQEYLAKVADLWPGPLTLVLPRGNAIPDMVTAGQDTVAVRIPSHRVMQQILNVSQLPLAAPSANRSMYVSPTTAQHVADGLSDAVAAIIDGGPSDVGLESTIVSLIQRPRLLRPGIITAEQLATRFGMSIDELTSANIDPSGGAAISSALPKTDGELVALQAPGMMRQHYSPRTPLVFVDQSLPRQARRVGRIAFAALPPEQQAAYAAVEVLSESGDAQQIARNLFAALRRLDDAQLDAIVIDSVSDHGIGRAIMDRLRRASAQNPKQT